MCNLPQISEGFRFLEPKSLKGPESVIMLTFHSTSWEGDSYHVQRQCHRRLEFRGQCCTAAKCMHVVYMNGWVTQGSQYKCVQTASCKMKNIFFIEENEVQAIRLWIVLL